MKYDELATRYRGERASGYDAERVLTDSWRREHQAVESLLAQLPRGAAVLDVPVGTGRFLELYARYGLQPTGLDISSDMLARAGEKAKDLGLAADLREGDIRATPFADKSFQAAVCIRFLNWVDMNGVSAAISELARVANQLIVGIRCYYPAGTNVSGYSLWQRLRGAKQRLKRRVLGSPLTVHEKAAVEALFRELQLSVAGCVSTNPRHDRSDYLIYLLRPETGG